MVGRAQGSTSTEQDIFSNKPASAAQQLGNTEQAQVYGTGVRNKHCDNLVSTCEQVTALTNLFLPHSNLDSILESATRSIADLLALDHCGVCTIDENSMRIQARTSYSKAGSDFTLSQAVTSIPEFIGRVRVNERNQPPHAHEKSTDDEYSGEFMLTTPLRVDKQIGGYLYALRDRASGDKFIDSEKMIFVALSRSVSAAIEVYLTRKMLDYPCIAPLLRPSERKFLHNLGETKQSLFYSIEHPEKFTQKMAALFFGDLQKAGFQVNHILCVATELIDNINKVLLSTKNGR